MNITGIYCTSGYKLNKNIGVRKINIYNMNIINNILKLTYE